MRIIKKKLEKEIMFYIIFLWSKNSCIVYQQLEVKNKPSQCILFIIINCGCGGGGIPFRVNEHRVIFSGRRSLAGCWEGLFFLAEKIWALAPCEHLIKETFGASLFQWQHLDTAIYRMIIDLKEVAVTTPAPSQKVQRFSVKCTWSSHT